jgi:hypothetical protein
MWAYRTESLSYREPSNRRYLSFAMSPGVQTKSLRGQRTSVSDQAKTVLTKITSLSSSTIRNAQEDQSLCPPSTDKRPKPVQFYKRKSQEKHLAYGRNFLTFQTARLSEGSSCLPPHALGTLHSLSGLFGFSLIAVSSCFVTKPVRLRYASRTVVGCQLWFYLRLFAYRVSGYPRGLGSSKRLCARDPQRLTSQCRLALEPECRTKLLFVSTSTCRHV